MHKQEISEIPINGSHHHLVQSIVSIDSKFQLEDGTRKIKEVELSPVKFGKTDQSNLIEDLIDKDSIKFID
jgi:hypothetical protein